MELLTYKSNTTEYTYYLGKNGERVIHGYQINYFNSTYIPVLIMQYVHGLRQGIFEEYYRPHFPQQYIGKRGFFYNDTVHGEIALFSANGSIHPTSHYVNGKCHPAVEMTDQEKLLFQIKHPGFQFLPKEPPETLLRDVVNGITVTNKLIQKINEK